MDKIVRQSPLDSVSEKTLWMFSMFLGGLAGLE